MSVSYFEPDIIFRLSKTSDDIIHSEKITFNKSVYYDYTMFYVMGEGKWTKKYGIYKKDILVNKNTILIGFSLGTLPNFVLEIYDFYERKKLITLHEKILLTINNYFTCFLFQQLSFIKSEILNSMDEIDSVTLINKSLCNLLNPVSYEIYEKEDLISEKKLFSHSNGKLVAINIVIDTYYFSYKFLNIKNVTYNQEKIEFLSILENSISSMFKDVSLKKIEQSEVLDNNFDLTKVEEIFEELASNEKQLIFLQKTLSENLTLISNLFSIVNESQLNRANNTYASYEFYKGATGWHIRFNNKPVILSSKSQLGLKYIHRLIRFKGEYFSSYDLESINSSEKSKEYTEIRYSSNISVRNINSKEDYGNDEETLKKQLKRFLLEEPEANAPAEDLLFYYSQLYQITNSLMQIIHRTNYVKLNAFYWSKIKECEELIQDLDNDLFGQLIITKGRNIRKPMEVNTARRRINQRVSKNIDNAINSIDSTEMKVFLKNSIQKVNGTYAYKCDASNDIIWKLFIE